MQYSVDRYQIFRGEFLVRYCLPADPRLGGGAPHVDRGDRGYMKRILTFVLVLLCAVSLALAQNVSSSVLTTIVDPSNAPIPGAECTLINQGTSAAVTVRADGQGSCVFNIVQNGTYSLNVKVT